MLHLFITCMKTGYYVMFNPVFLVIVASHIRLRAMITVLHRDSKHRGEGRDDHRSRPDV